MKTNKKSKLDFKKFFDGVVIAEGNLKLYYPKKAIKNLFITFKGVFKNNKLKLCEEYLENDKKVIRNWEFKRVTDSLFIGNENNVKGIVKVNIEENRLVMKYSFKLKVWNFNLTVLIKDYMYQINKKEIINTTFISKFGIKLAEVILLYKKKS